MNQINFSEESQEIIKLFLHSKQHLFITGKAGTGKSTLLKHISGLDEEVILLAPTGIAAINIGGETIHSFFRLKPGYEIDEAKHMRLNNQIISKYANVHTIIIDEISMIRADILDAIDIFLQRVKDNPNPFGGVRMIFFGDLFQLPPVLMRDEKNQFLKEYQSPYFFSANVFKQKDLFSDPFTLKVVELSQIYRQTDPVFTDLLNAVRNNTITSEQMNILNKRVQKSDLYEDDLRINLVTTNALASKINQSKLERLNETAFEFVAAHDGNIENLRPNDQKVTLKPGAQVMFINNDSQKRWVNGTIGKVIGRKEEIDEDTGVKYKYVEVKLDNNKIVKVNPFTWSISKYLFRAGKFVREEIGTFTQIPLRLAWAITIHKSQGKTFNKVCIDIGSGSFAHGQTYVALSRCRTLEGTILVTPISKSDIKLDPVVLDYFSK